MSSSDPNILQHGFLPAVPALASIAFDILNKKQEKINIGKAATIFAVTYVSMRWLKPPVDKFSAKVPIL